MMCEYPRHFDVQMPKFLANLDRYRQNIARILEFLPDSKPVAAVAR
jgi:D-serine deaminase-like pyridoxal phosphate-dependent protein